MSSDPTEAICPSLARHCVVWYVEIDDPEDYQFPETLLAGDLCITSTGKFYWYSGSDWARIRPGN